MKRYFANLSLFKKLLISPSIVLIFLLIQGGFSYLGLTQLKQNMADIFHGRFGNYQTSARIAGNITLVHANLYKVISWANAKYDPDKINSLGKEQLKILEDIDRELKEISSLSSLKTEERTLLERVKNEFALYKTNSTSAIDLAESDLNMATMYMGNTDSQFQELNKSLTELLALEQKLSQTHYDAAVMSFARSILIILLLLVAGVFVSLASSILISRIISNSVAEIKQLAQKVAAGKTEIKIETSRTDEVGQVMFSLNDMVRSIRTLILDAESLARAAREGILTTRGDLSRHQGDFRKIIEGFNQTLDSVINPVSEAMEVMKATANKDLCLRMKQQYAGQLENFKEDVNVAIKNLDDALNQVTLAVAHVATASHQIAMSSQVLAQGANEQAVNLQGVTSRMDQVSNSFHDVTVNINSVSTKTQTNARNAEKARQLSEKAREVGEQGNEIMRRMEEVILKIKQSSDNTAKIIKTIDEISFQTNLLALNAAVEAARAGDAGKGFAVVAEEVRNLAQRSAEAAKNTSAMIEESIKNTEQGVRTTQEVSGMLKKITEGAREVNVLVADIASASRAQSEEIDQINKVANQVNEVVSQINSAMEQVRGVTEQNAANSEESASVAEELSGQAKELEFIVKTFSTSRTPGTKQIDELVPGPLDFTPIKKLPH